MSQFNDLIQKLQSDGVPEDEISLILAEITRASAVKLMTQMMAVLDDDQKEQIEEAETDEEVKKLLDLFYEAKYEQTTDAAIEKLQELFAEGYMNAQDTAE